MGAELIERRGVLYVRTTHPGGETWMRAERPRKWFPDEDAAEPRLGPRAHKHMPWRRGPDDQARPAGERLLPYDPMWTAWRGLLDGWGPTSGRAWTQRAPMQDEPRSHRTWVR